MTRKKWLLTIIGCLLVAVAGAGVRYLYRTYKYKEIVSNIDIAAVDLTEIADGVYEGSFDALLVGAEVEVTIKEHQITDIQLVKHKTELGKEAEVIVDKVVEAQSLQVDVISGATNSSNVILKSIEEALLANEEQ